MGVDWGNTPDSNAILIEFGEWSIKGAKPLHSIKSIKFIISC